MEGGVDVIKSLRKDRQGGDPWIVILDGDGNELISSNDPDGNNIGCPAKPHEIAHFVEMIKQSSDASEQELAAINEAVQASSKK